MSDDVVGRQRHLAVLGLLHDVRLCWQFDWLKCFENDDTGELAEFFGKRDFPRGDLWFEFELRLFFSLVFEMDTLHSIIESRERDDSISRKFRNMQFECRFLSDDSSPADASKSRVANVATDVVRRVMCWSGS